MTFRLIIRSAADGPRAPVAERPQAGGAARPGSVAAAAGVRGSGDPSTSGASRPALRMTKPAGPMDIHAHRPLTAAFPWATTRKHESAPKALGRHHARGRAPPARSRPRGERMAKIARLRHAPLRLVGEPATFPQVTSLRLRGAPSPALGAAAQNSKKRRAGGESVAIWCFLARSCSRAGSAPAAARRPRPPARGHPQAGARPTRKRRRRCRRSRPVRSFDSGGCAASAQDDRVFTSCAACAQDNESHDPPPARSAPWPEGEHLPAR